MEEDEFGSELGQCTCAFQSKANAAIQRQSVLLDNSDGGSSVGGMIEDGTRIVCELKRRRESIQCVANGGEERPLVQM